MAGLVSVADWIGSDETYFPSKRIPVGFDFPGEARKAVSACGWTIPEIKRGLTFEALFENRPYDIQREFINAVTGPGLYILEAPMGTGKTEAALHAAYRLMAAGHNQGLFFGPGSHHPRRLRRPRTLCRFVCWIFREKIKVNTCSASVAAMVHANHYLDGSYWRVSPDEIEVRCVLANLAGDILAGRFPSLPAKICRISASNEWMGHCRKSRRPIPNMPLKMG